MASERIPPLSSYTTALVLLPPPHIQSRVNPIRSTNDKAFPRWTAHLTMIFPFVEPAHLPKASSLIRDALSEAKLTPFTLQLDKVAEFKQRVYDTVYLGASSATGVQGVWSVVSSALGYSGRSFVPHLTLGQAHHGTPNLLREKGKLLLESPLQWEVGSVVILHKSTLEGGLMKVYEEIPISVTAAFPLSATIAGLQPTAYQFVSDKWNSSVPNTASRAPHALTLATYNVLSDADHPITPRLPKLISTLLSVQPFPDVICLQEVTDEFFRHLLADPLVRTRWPRSTHDPTSVLPGKHNIVFLARESLEFSMEYVQLRTKHKPAIALRLHNPSEADESRSLVVAGLHLTAGLSSSQQQTKMQELDSLLTFLRERYPKSQWILIGDTNIPTSQSIPASILDTFDDAWLVARGSEDGGATFDPDSNTLASETVKADRSPQRYDRIWTRRGCGIQVRDVSQFGNGPREASDHYGLTATIQLSSLVAMNIHDTLPVVLSTNAADRPQHIALRRTADSDADLQQFVRREGGFPTEEQQRERSDVTAALTAVFSLSNHPSADAESQTSEETPTVVRSQSVVKFEFVPVGSVGLGVDTQGSDMDILVVGNIPPRTFWTLARARLRKATTKSRNDGDPAKKWPGTDVMLKRFVKDASVQMMELLVGNVRVDLQYCSGSKVLESWHHIQHLPSADPIFLLPAPSLRTLNAYRDMMHVLNTLPPTSRPAFRLAHRAIKLFCISHGIYSSRLGFLGGIHITLLLSRVTLLRPASASASQLVVAFFATYANWDWAHESVTLPGLSDKTNYTRSPGREPMVILSVKKPVMNVVQNANKHTTSAIVSEFKEVYQRQLEGAPWSDVCGSGSTCGAEFQSRFIRSYESFAKVELLFWGSSVVKARAWMRFVESRLPHFLVLLQMSVPDLNARFWPARLVDGSSPVDLSTGMQCFYLVGLDAPKESTSVEKIQTALFAFEDKLRRDERFYDATNMFASVSRITPTELSETITPQPAWSDGGIDPDDEITDEEEDLEPSDEDRNPENAFVSVSSKQKKTQMQKSSRGGSTTSIAAAKLRTSSDVYNRLIWDRELDTEDYLIGYEDRFAGLMEMPLVNWKREVEDEAFVPFHRVVHFKRKSDGVLVWDRRNKIDHVFGSGVQRDSLEDSAIAR